VFKYLQILLLHCPAWTAGYEDGYPVFIDNNIDQERALAFLTYLSDGAFLSPELTEYMTLEMVVSRKLLCSQ
jgi:hypothetical protein